MQNAPLCSVELLLHALSSGKSTLTEGGGAGVSTSATAASVKRLDTRAKMVFSPTSVIIIHSSDTITVKLKVKLNSHFVQLVTEARAAHCFFFFFAAWLTKITLPLCDSVTPLWPNYNRQCRRDPQFIIKYLRSGG